MSVVSIQNHRSRTLYILLAIALLAIVVVGVLYTVNVLLPLWQAAHYHILAFQSRRP